MRKTIDMNWLDGTNACAEGIGWFRNTFGKRTPIREVKDKLQHEGRHDWIEWLLVRLFPDFCIEVSPDGECDGCRYKKRKCESPRSILNDFNRKLKENGL